ncbi:hypothetical protein JTB14_000365 [Gonioctena quinquepunctata]|nr:hypothetical protein JTB14_000365 [Gonioctena quinquepunctata]
MEFKSENWQTNIEVYACLFQTFSVFRLSENTKFLKKNAVPSVNLPALQHVLLPSTSRRAFREECHDNSEGPTVCGDPEKRSREDTSTVSEGNKGETKKLDERLKYNYSASPPKLLWKVKYANVKKKLAQKKLKMMKVKVCCLKRRVTSLKQVLRNVKKKKLLSENNTQFLEKSITGVPLSILKRKRTMTFNQQGFISSTGQPLPFPVGITILSQLITP